MSKGEQTRQAILDTAVRLASEVGLDGLTIGELAAATGMSKSGLFAHFGSREDLQLALLHHAAQQFTDDVLLPSLKEKRGLPRLQVIIERWLTRQQRSRLPGGCIFVAASTEFDDKPGPVRDEIGRYQHRWRDGLIRAIAFAVESGDLAPKTEVEQLAFEIYGLVLAAHHDERLFGDRHALDRARRGVAQRLAATRAQSKPRRARAA
jgi:AcrR family transcriptional regulator